MAGISSLLLAIPSGGCAPIEIFTGNSFDTHDEDSSSANPPAKSAQAGEEGPLSYAFDIASFRDDKSTLAWLAVLQGIVNRQGPRLFLRDSAERDWEHSYIVDGRNKSDERWMAHYREQYEVSFLELASLKEVLETFQPSFQGILVYDLREASEAILYASMTYGSLFNLLPVSHEQFESPIFPRQLFPQVRRFGDLTTAKSKREVYQWVADNILPLTERSLAFSDNKDSLAGSDYVAQRKGLFFRLDYSSAADQSILASLFSKLSPLADIFGWGDPSESDFVPWISRFGFTAHAIHEPSLSYHAAWRIEPHRLQTRSAVHPSLEEGKIALAFLLAEGDTPKILRSFYGGNWDSPCRGQTPLNWGINPKTIDLFPALAAHYFAAAHPLDSFFAAGSGAGYVLLNYLADDHLERYLQSTRNYLLRTNIHVLDAWFWDRFAPRRGFNNSTLRSRVVLDRMAAVLSDTLAGVVARKTFLERGSFNVNGTLPVQRADLYYWRANLQSSSPFAVQLKEAIEEELAGRSQEHLIIYLDLANGKDIPCLVRETMNLLSPNYEAVQLERLFQTRS